MSKHPRVWNEARYKDRIRQGRGQGEGCNYRPWISVQDFSSRGTVSRILGWKSGRVHHLMSNNELMYFYLLEWSEEVEDIREQYPLLDVGTTVDIASRAGIQHPVDSYSGFPYVMTTDFVITTKRGLVARAVKMSGELRSSRVVEKLEVERRFWKARGVPWGLVTEREISAIKARNIGWLHAFGVSCKFTPDFIDKRLLLAIKESYNNTCEPVRSLCARYDLAWDAKPGTSLMLFKYLAATKQIAVNLDEKMDLNQRRCGRFTEDGDTMSLKQEVNVI